MEKSETDGNTRPLNLPLEKSVCRSGSNIRTGHGTTDWFQIGKGVCQDYILSPCLFNLYAEFSSVQSLSRVQFFATPWTTACPASLFITNSQSPPKPMSIESVMPFNHLILCLSPSLPAFNHFPASRSFPMS